MKVLGLFLACLFVTCGLGQPVIAAQTYQDYYLKGGFVYTDDTGMSYNIALKNGTTAWKWSRALTTSTVAIDKYTVYAMDNRTKKLNSINKYDGKNRWTLQLDKAYNKAQFITGKYLVLSSENKTVMVNLYTKKAVWGKNHNLANVVFYGAIKAKNGSYYLMVKTTTETKFYKLKV